MTEPNSRQNKSHWDGEEFAHPTLCGCARGSGGIGMSNQEVFGQRGGSLVPCVSYAFEPGIMRRKGGHYWEEVSGTLRACPGDNQMAVVSCPVSDVVGPLACNTGPNGNDAGNFACNQAVDAGHVIPVVFVKSVSPRNNQEAPTFTETEVAYTMNTWDERHNPPKHMVVQTEAIAFQLNGDRDSPGVSVSPDTAFCLPANPMSDRSQAVAIAIQDVTGRDKKQNGKGYSEDGVSYTLDAAATQGVAIAIQPPNPSHRPIGMINMQGSKSNAVAQEDGPSYTLAAMHGHDVHAVVYPVCFQQNTRDEVRLVNGDGQIAGALMAEPGMKQQNYVAVPPMRNVVAFHPTQDPISSTDGSTHTMGTGTTGGYATVAVAYEVPCGAGASVISVGADCYNCSLTGDVAMTLKAGQGNPAVNQPTVIQKMMIGTDMYNGSITGDVACTMTAHGSNPSSSGPTVMEVVMRQLSLGTDVYNGAITGDVACTMTATGSSPNASGPTVMEIAPITVRETGFVKWIEDDVSNTLRRRENSGIFVIAPQIDGPIGSFQQNSMDGRGTLGFDEDTKVTRPVKPQADHQMVVYKVEEQHPIVFSSNMSVPDCCTEGVSPTLKLGGHGGGNPPAVAMQSAESVAYTLRSDANRDGKAKTPSPDAEGRVRLRDPGFNFNEEIAPTMDATQPHSVSYGMVVRRLTPMECERLQGFPDNYTDVEYRGKPAADGPRYKSLGNSMAVNCMQWLGERIQSVENAIGSSPGAPGNLTEVPVACREVSPTITAKMQGSSGWAPYNEADHLTPVAKVEKKPRAN